MGRSAGVLHRGWMGLKAAITGGTNRPSSTNVHAARTLLLETYSEGTEERIAGGCTTNCVVIAAVQIEEVRGQTRREDAHLKARPAVG